MGTYNKGMLGAVSGKVGPVVASRWRGIDYLRSMPTKNRKAITDLRVLAQRAKFQLVSKFLNAFAGLISIAYNNTGNQTAYNRALANLLDTAITGEYPDVKLDFTKVQLSKGSVADPVIDSVASTVAGKIDFTWRNDSGLGLAKASDKALLAAYCPDLGRAVYHMHGALRTAEEGSLNVSLFSGKQVHTWIAFMTDNNKVSNSVYAGMLTVA